MGTRKEGCIRQWGSPKITHHCCPQLRQPGLLHIRLVTPLPSILYGSAPALLHQALMTPFLYFKTTLSSGVQTPKREAQGLPAISWLQPAFLHHLCSLQPVPFSEHSTCYAFSYICPADANQLCQSPSPVFGAFTLLQALYIQALPFAGNSLSHPICQGSRYLFLSLQLECQLFSIASPDIPFTHPHTPRQNYFGLPSSFMHSTAVAVPTLCIYTA